MSTTLRALPFDKASVPWWIVLVGLLGLYVPSLVALYRGIWSAPEQGHGPMVLGVSLWLIYRQWPRMREAAKTTDPSAWGWPVLVVGLLLYIVGRSQDIPLFEIGSAIWILIAIGLLLIGPGAPLAQWFPLFFMMFMIPLPGVVVAELTMPMKMAVSYLADAILFAANYPIARTGVALQIGQYQLLVADACAGLHTLFTLEAMGLLYLNLVRHDSWFRNVSLAMLIVPISFTANVIRVMVLILVTYYLGDEAGQGFLHKLAGMVLFLSALGMIIGVDSALQYAVKVRKSTRTANVGVTDEKPRATRRSTTP